MKELVNSQLNIWITYQNSNENTKKIAVIESKVVQLEKIRYKDSQ